MYGPSVEYVDGCARGLCCDECLVMTDSERLPHFALARGLWVGDIPDELIGLSLVEQLLIARCSRTFYNVEITKPDVDSFREDVTTKALYNYLIKDSAVDRSMPMPITYIARIMDVTIIGIPDIQSRCPPIIAVRRRKVEAALHWLKKNNALYRGIIIDNERLATLPDYGVPGAIRSDIMFYG